MNELNKRVMVALDVNDLQEAFRLATALKGSGCWLKIGLELYAVGGPTIIEKFKELGFSVFLDLKLHDIPTTVERAVRALSNYGADMINVHCSGGYDMMAGAVEAARSNSNNCPKMIGVTVLTTMSEAQLQTELGFERRLEEQVTALAKLAQRAGMDGVVASALEAPVLRKECSSEFLLVTPGIRPASSENNDQVRVLTPRQAIEAGSSYLVVGRPITRAADPREALERLWD